MNNLKKLLTIFIEDEGGQDLVEYALITALVAFAAIAGISSVTTGVRAVFTAVGTKLTSAI
jgi:pilus assembly protein Flp/PilA